MPHESHGDRNPDRAHTWKLRSSTLRFGLRPLVMGIVNVTPDSFSDGGNFFDRSRAVDHALQLAADGADLLDVGGESTRPCASPVPVDEELNRVIPVVERICRDTVVPVSIDTSKAIVADHAVAAGAQVINDVTGLEGDPQMIDVACRRQAGVCAMHMQGTPATMQENPTYQDVVSEIEAYLRMRRDALVASGVDVDRICLDPGIGFGKTHQHNLTLVANCERFHALGRPLLVGHSRKGFLGKVLGDPNTDRLAATIGVSLALARQRVQVIRVHDVRPVREALLLFAAAGGIDGRPLELDG